ncbi:MAG: ABC transporter ATP-binding protein [Bacteroidales bacterium]|nr:ABC transporter ATP-binding protein [Bacteroidales bacterium]
MKDLGKIFRYIIPYKWYALFNVLFNALSTVFSIFSFGMAIPFLGILFGTQPMVTVKMPLNLADFDSIENNFYYWLSNIIEDRGPANALLAIGLLVMFFTFLKTATLYLANHFMVPIRNNVVRDIRNQMFHKVSGLPLGYFSDERKGNIIARMSSDVQEIEWGIMSSLEMLFRDPLKILFFLITMFAMSWQLTVFVLILLPVVGFIVGKVGKTLRKTSMIGQQQMGQMLSQIEEMIGGLRVVKAFNAEKHIRNKFYRDNQEYTNLMNGINRRRFLASPLSEFLATVAIVFVMWYGGKMVLSNDGGLSSQAFIGYLIIFSQIITPAKAFSTAWYNIKKGLASLDRVQEVMQASDRIEEKPDAVSIDGFNHQIEYRNVSFAYQHDFQVVTNINMVIPKGKTIALVGQSGSGKSTLVDLLPRFYDIQSGEVCIDGTDIRNLKLKELRDLIGYVNQSPILFNDNFYHNIAFGLEHVSIEDVIAAAKVANAHDFIMESEKGYDTNIGDSGNKLSGGQKQRISIARAVLKNPPILILDEATSALDTESEKLVQQALENLMKNRTSIVIAHRLSTIKKADTICVIHEGRLVEKGRHKELLEQNGMYTKLYNLQMS